MRVNGQHVESAGVGVAGDLAQRWDGRCGQQQRGMERDVLERHGRGPHGPVQLLGVEHRRRSPHAVDNQREHPDDPRRDAVAEAVLAGVEPVRAEPGDIGPDGGADAAVPPRVLHRRRLRAHQVVVPDAVHTHNTRLPRLHLQHHRHRCRQVRFEHLYTRQPRRGRSGTRLSQQKYLVLLLERYQ